VTFVPIITGTVHEDQCHVCGARHTCGYLSEISSRPCPASTALACRETRAATSPGVEEGDCPGLSLCGAVFAERTRIGVPRLAKALASPVPVTASWQRCATSTRGREILPRHLAPGWTLARFGIPPSLRFDGKPVSSVRVASDTSHRSCPGYAPSMVCYVFS
jgi:hypothetical protein